MQRFASFPPAVAANNDPVDKPRGKIEKLAEYYNQAGLFFNNQSSVEKARILGAFSFELSKVTVPAIRQHMVAKLRTASEALATSLATCWVSSFPRQCPRRAKASPRWKFETAPSLSLMAIPDAASISTRKLAILVADGMTGAPISHAIEALKRER